MKWALGLSAWIVQDGNYGDFARGDRIEVAVEFGFHASPTLAVITPRVAHVDGNTYEITGRVVHVEPDVWVVDIGILIFNDGTPPVGVAVGDCVSGRAWLGIDHFSYFERFSKRESVPPMIYSWSVKRIQKQTAPILAEGRLRFRDPARIGWTDVVKTNAWDDDGGHAEYIVECELLDVPPKRRSLTAT